MIDLLNIFAALLTIGFGLFGFLAPRYTAGALDLAPTFSTMGLSEMRASVGGLFVVAGAAAIWLNAPLAYAMIGFAFAGAATGRVLSLISSGTAAVVPVSLALAGPLADAVGIGVWYVLSGGACILLGLTAFTITPLMQLEAGSRAEAGAIPAR